MCRSLPRPRALLRTAALALVALALLAPTAYASLPDPGGGPAGPPVIAATPAAAPWRPPAVKHRSAPIRPPLAAPAGSGPAVRVPILMYHYIRDNAGPQDRTGADLSVSPVHFAAQMDWLAAHGYQTITLDAVVSALRYKTPLPPQPVVLTFDDGYADFYTAAYPVLQSRGFRATSFIITGRVGEAGFLTWDALLAMQAGGLVTFGAHTVHHVDLAAVPLVTAQYELASSKATLEAHLGRPVRAFCYPSGEYTAAVEHLVAADGYQAAVTTRPGQVEYASGLLTMPRVRIHGADTLAAFARDLGGEAPPAEPAVPVDPAPPVVLPLPVPVVPHLLPRPPVTRQPG